MGSPYSVVVSSTDSFADTWEPFFTLMKAYWVPGPAVPIYLNAEHGSIRVEGLDVRCTRVGRFFPDRHPTWSESMSAALALVDSEYVLYVQDDYFLYAPVRADVIQEAVDLMRFHGLAHVRLLDGSSKVARGPHPMLETIRRGSRYYLSLQAGLWHRATLRRLLRLHESPWEFELVGSHRARRSRARLTRLSFDPYHALDQRAFPYEPTGIVKGRWERRIVEPLFGAHGIEVDFARRGFTEDAVHDRGGAARWTWGKALRRVRSLV